jgi:hypothetical protein
MKKWLVVGLLTLLFSCKRNSSSSSIPDEVLMSFNDTYPEAEKVKWASDNESYKVSFKEGGITKEVIYELNGTFVKEE